MKWKNPCNNISNNKQRKCSRHSRQAAATRAALPAQTRADTDTAAYKQYMHTCTQAEKMATKFSQWLKEVCSGSMLYTDQPTKTAPHQPTAQSPEQQQRQPLPAHLREVAAVGPAHDACGGERAVHNPLPVAVLPPLLACTNTRCRGSRGWASKEKGTESDETGARG